MTKKSQGANEDQVKEPKRKIVPLKSQKEAKEVKSSKKEEDLLLDSGTDSDYDGCSLSGSLNSDDFDSEDDFDSHRETQDDSGHEGSDEVIDSENGEEEDGSDDEGSEQREVAEESDSSEDEVDASPL
ncbi:hypothetical protein HID58_010255 [Brassica napus]|uniref:Uncharacterized protein n=1 Tax=Brassica napus TaxID=3708 RepID=A0ABQ8DV77_BRANA|nr:hypothetical protein HID58_010255 [Brassica napus]